MSGAGIVAIIARPTDPLAAGLIKGLGPSTADLIVCDPGRLADLTIAVDSHGLRVDGRPTTCVVWRVTPGMLLSEGFPPEDQAFASSEVAAAWVSALNSPTVYAVNRYSASVWYGGCHWPAWHSWLRDQCVPVSPFRLGAQPSQEGVQWLPFLSGGSPKPIPDQTAGRAMGIATMAAEPSGSAIVVAGEILHAAASRTVRAAAAALAKSGVVLARLTMDSHDRVLSVDTTPEFTQDDELELVVDRLAEVIRARLRAR